LTSRRLEISSEISCRPQGGFRFTATCPHGPHFSRVPARFCHALFRKAGFVNPASRALAGLSPRLPVTPSPTRRGAQRSRDYSGRAAATVPADACSQRRIRSRTRKLPILPDRRAARRANPQPHGERGQRRCNPAGAHLPPLPAVPCAVHRPILTWNAQGIPRQSCNLCWLAARRRGRSVCRRGPP
jgi:hypothetical protein